LHVAVGQGHVEIVQTLLDHGADQSLRIQGNYTPLQLAQFNKHEELIALLSNDRGPAAPAPVPQAPVDVAVTADRREALYRSGNEHYAARRYEQAIERYSEMLELAPRDAGALRARGIARFSAGNAVAALADFNALIEIAPADPDGYANRGVVLFKQGEFDRAIADLTRALELAPGSATTLYNRGRVYERQGNVDAALADFRAALEADDGFPGVAEAIRRLSADDRAGPSPG
jgi:tetratricopeptide (TPR) repeat protein